jgi:hypothetical protein
MSKTTPVEIVTVSHVRGLCAGVKFKGKPVASTQNIYTEMEVYSPPRDGYAEIKILFAKTPPAAGASPLPFVLRAGQHALFSHWDQTTADKLQNGIGKKAINPDLLEPLEPGKAYWLMPTETIEIHTCGRGSNSAYVYFYLQIVEHGNDRRTNPAGDRGAGHLPEPFTDIPLDLMA